MHHHRNGGPPPELPNPWGPEYRAQKIVLLELVLGPPDCGDPIEELRDGLGLVAADVDPAVAALERAGLAEWRGDFVRASQSARYFEHLWPVLL